MENNNNDNYNNEQVPVKPKKTRSSLRLGLVVIVAIVALLVIFLSGRNGANAAGATADVSISNSGFVPAVISVKAGTTVTWTNNDAAVHWVASDPYPVDNGLSDLNSYQALHHSDTYSYRFISTGRYTYHDQLNPYKFKGTVVVH